jgi:hypothetical protein
MGEPILWSHHAGKTRTQVARVWNADAGEWEVAIDEDTGLPIREKIPQSGHEDGDYDKPNVDRNINRAIHFLRHDGHVTRNVINMAAADIEGVDFVGKVVRQKARFLGWIPVGRCPIAMRQSGALKKHQIACKDLRDAEKACESSSEKKPCPHYFQEEAARKTRQKATQAKKTAAMQTDADKMIAAQQAQTKDIVTGVAGVLADAIKSLKEQAPADPPPSGDAPPAAPCSSDAPKKGRG